MENLTFDELIETGYLDIENIMEEQDCDYVNYIVKDGNMILTLYKNNKKGEKVFHSEITVKIPQISKLNG
jgi:hypothetical protein